MPGFKPAPPPAARSPPPAYPSDHTFPAHGAWTFQNRPSRQARWSPTQPGPSPALRAGTHLTPVVPFKDTAVCNPAVGGGRGGVFSRLPSSSKHKHARRPTMPGWIPAPGLSPAPCSPTRCCLGEAGGGCRQWRADAGMQDCGQGGAGGAHLFDLIILQLGEVIGQ